MNKKFLSLLAVPFILSACAEDINSNHYATSSTGRVASVAQCTVMSIRAVNVNSNTGKGSLLGGVAGGVAGSTIGHGDATNTLGAVGGALIGGLVGEMAEKGLTSQTGLEYILKLDDGRIISIAQGQGEPLSVGQRCLVLYGNPSRVIAQ